MPGKRLHNILSAPFAVAVAAMAVSAIVVPAGCEPRTEPTPAAARAAKPVGPGSPRSGTKRQLPLPRRLRWQQSRFERLDMDRFAAALGVRPTMTVLDIGAGAGFFTAEIARRVGPSGRVIATDTNPRMIAIIEEHAAGLGNVEAVLVTGKGLDPVYRQHRYDRVLVINTFQYIDDRVSFFTELRKQLTADGKLVVMPAFQSLSVRDLRAPQGLLEDLASEPPSGPYGRGLRPETASALRALGDAPAPAALLDGVITDLNTLSRSIAFLRGHLEGPRLRADVSLTPKEAETFAWLLGALDPQNAAESDAQAMEQLSAKELRTLQRLGRLLVIQRFRRHLRPDIHTPPIQEVRANHPIARDMLAAGFDLVDLYTPQRSLEYGLIFRPSARAAQMDLDPPR